MEITHIIGNHKFRIIADTEEEINERIALLEKSFSQEEITEE